MAADSDNIGLKFKNPLSSPKPDLALVYTGKNQLQGFEYSTTVLHNGLNMTVTIVDDYKGTRRIKIRGASGRERIFTHINVKDGDVLEFFFNQFMMKKDSEVVRLKVPSNAKEIRIASELSQDDEEEPFQAFVDDDAPIGPLFGSKVKRAATKVKHIARGDKMKALIAVSGNWGVYTVNNPLLLARVSEKGIRAEYKIYYKPPSAIGGYLVFVRNGEEHVQFVTAKSIIQVDLSKWGNWLQMIKFLVSGKKGTSTEEYDRYVSEIQKGKHTSRFKTTQGLVAASMNEGNVASLAGDDEYEQIGVNIFTQASRAARGVNTTFFITLGDPEDNPNRKNNPQTLENRTSLTPKGLVKKHYQMYYEQRSDGGWNIVFVNNGEEERFKVKPHSVVRVDFNKWGDRGAFFTVISTRHDQWKKEILAGKHTNRWKNQAALVFAPINHEEFFPNFH